MNYFEYFTEIEDRFSRRRGSILLLNTLDWALIETWREAGVPLEAVLRGIDNAFDKHDLKKTARPTKKINGLAWCSQAVMQAAEELVEASTGLAPLKPQHESGFETERVATYLDRNASALEAAATSENISLFTTKNLPTGERITPLSERIYLAAESSLTSELITPSMESSSLKGMGFSPSIPSPERNGALAPEGIFQTTAIRLHELATAMRSPQPLPLDDLDRTLTVLEDKLFAALEASATEQQLVDLKTQADRELAPFRAKMSAVQLRQVHQQFLHKRLLELHNLPRLSLFYMGHAE